MTYAAVLIQTTSIPILKMSSLQVLTSGMIHYLLLLVLLHLTFLQSKKDIIHSFLLLKRSAEEMSMLKLEMKETLNYWLQRIDIIKIFLSNIESEDQFARGSQCLLMRMLSECQCHYDRAYSYFTGIIEISVTEAVRSTIADSDKSDSESDAESGSENESDDEVDIGEVEDDENIVDF